CLLKLLHSGPTKYIYSSNEIKHFFSSESDREEILIDAFQAGVLPGWLRYASGFTSKAEIVNPSSIVSVLLNISKTAFTEQGQNLTDDISYFIISIISSIEDYETKKAIIYELSSNHVSFSVSEHILVRLLSKCRIWKDGVFNGLPEYSEHELKDYPIKPKDLIEAKNIWLATLRNEASKIDITSCEPEPISIFFRWGQLNDNNYTEVQEYIEKLTGDENGLRAF
ncbi:MAG TPA: hypothetical protein DDX14_05220, partial [Cyanobacteria bacterium UBA9579]|nr:hypothetical protein [Cyanobacteria bacterium UBA9579]